MSDTEHQSGMERLFDIIGASIAVGEPFDRGSYIEMQCRADNEKQGRLPDYDCPKCRNKGVVYFVADGEERVKECECMALRRERKMIRESGLEDKLRTMTFDTFCAANDWQHTILNKARQFTEQTGCSCFFIGGQSGSGKTHICSAIVGNLIMQQKIPTRYFIWETKIKEILALSGNDDRQAKEKIVKGLMNIDALYLDDFFRKEKISQAERSIAFDIINYRYNKGLATVISSERYLDEVCSVDEAIGSRIKEMCGNKFSLSVARSSERNYRFNGSEIK